MTKILSVSEVRERTNKSRSTLWRSVRAGTFPAPVKVGLSRIGWLENEIEEWQDSLPRAWAPANSEPGEAAEAA